MVSRKDAKSFGLQREPIHAAVKKPDRLVSIESVVPLAINKVPGGTETSADALDAQDGQAKGRAPIRYHSCSFHHTLLSRLSLTRTVVGVLWNPLAFKLVCAQTLTKDNPLKRTDSRSRCIGSTETGGNRIDVTNLCPAVLHPYMRLIGIWKSGDAYACTRQRAAALVYFGFSEWEERILP